MSFDITVESGKSVRLPTSGKYCDRDIVVTATGGGSGGGGGGSVEWIGDGNTHLWITLPEGRTSPILRVYIKGTVTVDWGDGTTPDVLSDTWGGYKTTPVHEYAAPGDYIITMTADGKMYLREGSNTDGCSIFGDTVTGHYAYRNALRKVEMGSGVTNIERYTFHNCYSLEAVKMPDNMTSIEIGTFRNCSRLTSVEIPNGVTSIGGEAFEGCRSLTSVEIPDGVTSIEQDAFNGCSGLTSVEIPAGVTSIKNYAFYNCSGLVSVEIPGSVSSIGWHAFNGCSRLTSVEIPDGVISIGYMAFYNCYSLTSVKIPASVTSIEQNAFSFCYSVRYYDFTNCTEVPALGSSSALSNIPADCEIRVPTALYDEWIAATNWATYASKIVAV